MAGLTRSKEYRAMMVILRDARNAAGLSQGDVADRLRKPQSYVSKVEGGDRRIDVIEFIEFAYAIDVDPRALFRLVLKVVRAPRRTARRR